MKNHKNRYLSSLFSVRIYCVYKQHVIGKMVNSLKDNSVTEEEIPSIEKELHINSSAILSDISLLIALFSVIIATTSNLYVPYHISIPYF